ncbi:hypothetical protein ACFUGD_32560 [Streptomyces sp. NPDC057217]|uniref:hypothetical protein n=1 Tax=Streptomyces sp. NPDC057217 TaxID=3346054 RepID=UPI003641763F
MERSARRLATLVPALLCAIWSLLLTQPATADPAATSPPRVSPTGAGAATSAFPDRTPEARTAPVFPRSDPARTAPAAIPLLPDPTPAVRTAPASAPVSPSPSPDPARTTQVSPNSTPARTAPIPPAPAVSPPPVPVHRFAPPEPHLAPAAVVGLPAVVEHSVRFPTAPAAPAAVPVDLSLPPRGLLAGDPRRERAPPGGPYVPRDPRGPPSTRHS